MAGWQPDYDPRRGTGQPPATPPQWQQGTPPQYQQPRPQMRFGDPAWTPQPPRQYQQPYYPPQSPQRPRRPRKGLAFLGCGGLGGLVVLIAVLAAPSSPSSSTSAGTQTQAAAPPASSAAPAKPVAAKTVASFSGSGTQKTAQFTVTSTWKLAYSFDCASFGYKGNFQVFEDGGSDLSGVTVNDLAMSKTSSTYAYDDAGTHYLEVNSECSWTVKVIDEG